MGLIEDLADELGLDTTTLRAALTEGGEALQPTYLPTVNPTGSVAAPVAECIGVAGTVPLIANARRVITHNLGTVAVEVQTWRLSDGVSVSLSPIVVDANTVSVLSTTTDNFRVVILGTTSVIPLPPSVYADAVLNTAGLLSYWRLGDVASPVLDEVGGLNGAVTGGALGSPGLLNGDPDTAWLKTVAGSWIDLGNNYSFAGVTPFSIELLVKPSAVPLSSLPIIGRHDGNVTGWMLIHDGDKIDFFRNASVIQTPGTAVAGATTHIVATYDANVKRIYVNGVLAITGGTDVTALNTANINLTVGYLPAYGTGLLGTYDEIAIYGVALDAATIADHYSKA